MITLKMCVIKTKRHWDVHFDHVAWGDVCQVCQVNVTLPHPTPQNGKFGMSLCAVHTEEGRS